MEWVLSLPHRVRYLLAWDHDLCRAVTAVFLRAVMGFLRDRATRGGAAHGRGGAVAIVQRFGAALNLNVHVHALVLDGVFAVGANGRPAFREVDPPSDEDVGLVLGVVRRRVERLLDRRGHGVDDNHAGVVAPAAHRHRLERLCRYGLRPPVAEERLQVTSDGQVLLRLRHRWSDGTTDILFEPTEFLERLAAITPRPRINLVLYYGVLAPRAGRRAAIVGESAATAHGGADRAREGSGARADAERCPTSEPAAPSWAALMRRAFGFDVLACPRCGHGMRLIALIEQAEVIRRILRHLGEPTEVPPPAPARAPPLLGAGYQSLAADDAPGLAYEREPAPDYDEPC